MREARKRQKAGAPTRAGKAVVSKRDLSNLEVFQVACTAWAGKALSCIEAMGVALACSMGLPRGWQGSCC